MSGTEDLEHRLGNQRKSLDVVHVVLVVVVLSQILLTSYLFTLVFSIKVVHIEIMRPRNFLRLLKWHISGMAFLVFLYVVFRTFTSKEHVADNYWGKGATTLEWTQTSPPAHHTFLELPRIS